MSAELNETELDSILEEGDFDAARKVSVKVAREIGLTTETIVALLGESARKYSPNQPRDERGRWTDSGINAAGMEVVREAAGQQANNIYIRRFMEAHGLTLEDYKAVNDLFYSHNQQHTVETDAKIREVWNSDTSQGRAMRLFADWNEWQVENVPRPPVSFDPELVMQRLDNVTDWSRQRAFFEDGNLYETKDAFANAMLARARGEWIFYRKGDLHSGVVSTTTNSRGAQSGGSRFVPTNAWTYRQLRDSGYRLIAGARGMIGVTSADESEHLWLYTGTRKYSPNQPRDERGRWTDTIFSVANINATIDFLTSPTVVSVGVGALASVILSRITGGDVVTSDMAGYIAAALFAMNADRWDEARADFTGALKELIALRLGKADEKDPVVQILDAILKEILLIDPEAELAKYSPNQPRDDRGRWISANRGVSVFEALRDIGTGERDFEIYEEEVGLFHGTATDAWNSIKENGLVPRKTPGADAWVRDVARVEEERLAHFDVGDRPQSVFLSPDWSVAEDFAVRAASVRDANPLILKVVLPVDAFHGVRVDEAGDYRNPIGRFDYLRHVGTIPPEYISVHGWLDDEGTMRYGEPPATKVALIQFFVVILCSDKVTKFNPNQPRDERGRWTRTGGGDIVFHGTSDELAESIKKEGIKIGPAAGGHNFPYGLYARIPGRDASAFVTLERLNAEFYAETAARNMRRERPTYGVPTVIEVTVPPGDWVEWDFISDEYDPKSFRTSRTIPPEWITGMWKRPFLPDEGDGLSTWGDWERVPLSKVDGIKIYLAIVVQEPVEKYSPNQPRDERGRWTSTGASAAIEQVSSDGSTLAPIPEDISNWFGEYRVIREAGDIPGGVGEAIRAIPEEHLSLLHDTTISLNETVQASYYHPNRGYIEEEDVLGIYHPAQGTGDDSIQIAYRAAGRDAKSISGTTLHEIGHAIDFKHGNRLGASAFNWLNYSMGLARYPMTDHEKQISAYYFKNTRERAAELYAMTYNPNFSAEGAFGLPAFRASELFGVASDRLRNTNLTNLNWESPDYLGLKN